MAGDGRVRFCPYRRQNVYNLSGMSKEQATALMRAKERAPCIRFYRRRDGTVMTADCPVGVRRIAADAWRWTAAAAATGLAFVLGLFGWAVAGPRATMGSCGSSSSRQGVTMGEPVPRPPLVVEGRQPDANNRNDDGDDEAPPRP
jgi:hypothetical protein